MDYLNSSIKIAQTVLPPAIQYFGRAKEREAKLAQTQEDLAQTRAAFEVMVIKSAELKQSKEQTEEQNKKLTREKENLEAFRNIILILLAVALVAYIGTVLIPKTA